MFFYTFLIRLYGFAIQFVAFWNPKAQKWIEGRRDWRMQLKNNVPKNKAVLWFHASSLGEFEQARPVIESLRSAHTQAFFLLTFYSPSGYEIRKEYEHVDFVSYLPLDTPKNAQDFISIVSPSIALFAKYDFWFNLLSKIVEHQIPCCFFSCSFRKDQFLFSPLGKPFLNHLKNLNKIFVQDEKSLELLLNKGFLNTELGGDTRIDRVVQISKESSRDYIVKHKNQKLLVVGSAYQTEFDMAVAFAKAFGNYDILVAPHTIDYHVLKQWEKQLNEHGFSSTYFTKTGLEFSARFLFLDTIGLLNKIYANAHVVLLGGGFGKSVHNILEPSVYGMPVFFGPNHNKFPEAQQLIELGAAFEISSAQAFTSQVKYAETNLEQIRAASHRFFTSNVGATAKVLAWADNLLKK